MGNQRVVVVGGGTGGIVVAIRKYGRTMVAVVLTAALLVAITQRDRLRVEYLQGVLDRTGPWAPAVFVALYAVATVVCLPGAVLTATGGFLFGYVHGAICSLAGATTGAVLSFLIARFMAAGWVRREMGPRAKRLVEGVEADGWRFVAFVRLVPLFPFNVLNYALGLTRIDLFAYTASTLVCMVPGAFVYAYLGYVGAEALRGKEGALIKGLWAIGFLATAVFVPRLIGRMKSRASGGDDRRPSQTTSS